LRHTSGKARTKNKEAMKVDVCPRCGSANIKFSSKFDVWLMPKQYVCYDCGYTGPIVLELEEDKTEPKKPKEKK
jgi:predicted RNA-binding Zn-ribbon protein involved in translation (DUF1610 family)